MKNKTSTQEKRENIKKLSKAVKPLVDSGEYSTINEAIINAMYKTDGHEVFNSYKNWQLEGKQVKRGSVAFVIWGTPRRTKNQEAEKGEKDEYKFFPLAFLFSNKQVEDVTS